MLDILKHRQEDLFQGLEFFKKERLWRKKSLEVFTNAPRMILKDADRCIFDLEARLKVYAMLEGKPFTDDYVKTVEYLDDLAKKIDARAIDGKLNPVDVILVGETQVLAGIVEAEWHEVNPTWVRVKPKKGEKDGTGRSDQHTTG